MKHLSTGIRTEIVNGRVEVYDKHEQKLTWWEKVKKNHGLLNPINHANNFFEWFEKIKSVHIITNEEAERIIKKLGNENK